jgi:hypothetical protein
MEEPKQGEQPMLNLAQDGNEEEGDESQVLLDMGENLMIQREMVIPRKDQR